MKCGISNQWHKGIAHFSTGDFPMDRGDWWASVRGVTKNQAQLNNTLQGL